MASLAEAVAPHMTHIAMIAVAGVVAGGVVTQVESLKNKPKTQFRIMVGIALVCILLVILLVKYMKPPTGLRSRRSGLATETGNLASSCSCGCASGNCACGAACGCGCNAPSNRIIGGISSAVDDIYAGSTPGNKTQSASDGSDLYEMMTVSRKSGLRETRNFTKSKWRNADSVLDERAEDSSLAALAHAVSRAPAGSVSANADAMLAARGSVRDSTGAEKSDCGCDL